MRKPKTILIIEDDADIQNFIGRLLGLEGYQVLRAADGVIGMEILRKNRPDLIILDLRLPGRSGWAVLQEIRRDPSLAAIPVVVLTAIAEANQRQKTLRMGATKYLTKPLSARRLSQVIAGIFSQERKVLPVTSGHADITV